MTASPVVLTSPLGVVAVLLVVAIVVLVVVGILAWKALSLHGSETASVSPAARAVAPDDDADFLRRLGERVRREDEDPPMS